MRCRRMGAIILGLILLVVGTQPIWACSAFCLKDGDHVVAAKNYDYGFSDGFVMVNKRGIAKVAMLLGPGDTPADWVSRYGSVTFNQYGREMPIGGMNEAGLVVETLVLPSTKYPAPNTRPAVMSWMQYQLDCHATVAEVLASDERTRMHYAMPMPLHFFVCDRQGHTATVEFIDGKLVCHQAESMPIQAITNDTYEASMKYVGQCEGFGGTQAIPHGNPGSLERFACVADRLKAYESGSAASLVTYAFETLGQVTQGKATQWRIVYDVTNREIHYRTQTRPETKTVKFGDLNFACAEPVQMIGINTPHTGLLNPHFFDYDPELNRHLVFYSIRHTPQTAFLPEAVIKQLAAYPETTTCK